MNKFYIILFAAVMCVMASLPYPYKNGYTEPESITESITVQYDTLCQVNLFRDKQGKNYISAKYKTGEYIDMCEPLGIIVRESHRMCNVPKKVIPSNTIPKRVKYSGNIAGY